MLREAVGLVADVLEQLQAEVVPRQLQRLALGLHVDQLLLLRQRDDHRRLDVHRLEDFQRRVELAEAAVDEDHVGVQLVVAAGLAVAAADDFLDGQVVVVPLPVLDLVAAVAVLERHAVDEADLGADHLAALEVGDVDRLRRSAAARPARALPAELDTPSFGLVTNASGCQNSCSPLPRALPERIEAP